MIMIPSAGVLLVAAASLLVLMTCQWIISGMSLRNHHAQKRIRGSDYGVSEFNQAA
jgi:hypothetical protein